MSRTTTYGMGGLFVRSNIKLLDPPLVLFFGYLDRVFDDIVAHQGDVG